MRAEVLLPSVFFLSGAAALVEQLAWQRMLVLFAGGDVRAMTLVLCAFMAGLGVGSALGGKIADRLSVRGCILGFVVAELGIAACAMASPRVFGFLMNSSFSLHLASSGWRIAVLFGCLLVPTFFMGMSLPLLVRALRGSGLGGVYSVCFLYGVNTLGAAAGGLAATWALLPVGGIPFGLKVAALVHALCGCLAIISPSAGGNAASLAQAPESTSREWRLLPYLTAFFLSGFVFIGAELAWFRVLGALAKASAHTVGTFLSIYLLGNGLGAAWGACRANPAKQSWARLLGIQGWAAVYASAGVPLVLACLRRTRFLAYLEGYEPVDAQTACQLLAGWWNGRVPLDQASELWVHGLFHVGVPCVVMLPPALLMGWSFVLMQRAVFSGASPLSARVGALQAANMAGSIAGALGVFGILLPLGGSALVFRFLATIGAGLIAAAARGWMRTAALGAGGLLVLFLPDQRALWSGVHGSSGKNFWISEDASGVSVLKRDDPAGRISVFCNGIGQSWIPYGGIHTLLGVLPVLLHENPQRAAVIGLGSGDTLYALLARDSIREVWCAEIVSGQRRTLAAAAGDASLDAASALLRDPRVRLHEGDGRRLLFCDRDGFDIVEADALRPTSAHAGSLYSEEYFDLLRSRLRPGGIAVTWLPTTRVVHTMAKVFPYTTVFGGLVGVGSMEPLRLDAAKMEGLLKSPGFVTHFQRAGLPVESLLQQLSALASSIQVCTPAVDRSQFTDTNTDLFPRDEWAIPSLWKNSGGNPGTPAGGAAQAPGP
jgi:hypothetical protein